MSLIAQMEASKINQRRGAAEATESEHKILQPAMLMRILNEALDTKCLPKKTTKKWSSYRSRLKDTSWPLQSLLGTVTEEIWTNICEASIAAMLKNVIHSQPNGDWRLCQYEADIRRNRDGDEMIMVVVKWMDANNKNDLTYSNGVPSSVNVNVNTSPLAPEILDALKERGNNSSDDELKGLLKGLISVMAQGQSEPIVAAITPEPEDVHLAE
jgi:hypothetical protein